MQLRADLLLIFQKWIYKFIIPIALYNFSRV